MTLSDGLMWVSAQDVKCGWSGTAAFGLLGALPAAALPALVLMTAGELAIAFSDVVIDGAHHAKQSVSHEL